MPSIKIQCPAKINLTLKVINKREDGFHNIESIMQAINLFDFLTINIEDSNITEILLDGNSADIPYNETNLVYKAAKLFLEETNISNKKITVFIDKNIPVSAGLAGGSTNAAGMLYGLNKLFNNILSESELHQLCAKLGSDLNFCLKGGCMMTKGRGEILEPHEYIERNINLIKPISLGISAKEAYTKFSEKVTDPKNRENYVNDLEWAVIDDYSELKHIKNKYPSAIMTGSGSTYYSFDDEFTNEDGYWIKNGLKTINYGVKSI
ncbi:4-(cytidine 5'-diphospho)-2-C-methyl-D-erythritol kinase [bacterium]|nr:4-(cytidine 5'-diphospho)-2-C-methyl-D-erythritol kinase [bacterium]